jgi:hypothetical protein
MSVLWTRSYRNGPKMTRIRPIRTRGIIRVDSIRNLDVDS